MYDHGKKISGSNCYIKRRNQADMDCRIMPEFRFTQRAAGFFWKKYGFYLDKPVLSAVPADGMDGMKDSAEFSRLTASL